MKRILPIFLIMVLVLLPCCSEKPDMDLPGEDEIHTSQVITRCIAEYGDYIYFRATKMMRYNRKTGVMQPLCTDPDCGSDCLLCSPVNETTQIVDGKLYGCYMLPFTRECVYACYDLVTNEMKVLLTLPRDEAADVQPPVLDGGYLYYTGQYLREGGSAKNPDDYQPYVGRIPTDGGKAEVMCPMESRYSERFLTVADGKAITSLNDCLYATDFETDERSLLFDPEEHGLARRYEWYSYLDGYLYMLYRAPGSSKVTATYQDIEIPSSMGYQFLVKIDPRTGEMTQLLGDRVEFFWLTEDTIYYTELGYRMFYVPEDYVYDENDPFNKTVLSESLDTLYACDLDGSNRRAVYTDPLTIFSYQGTVIDNCYYGNLREYDETQHKTKLVYGKIDFTTGEFTPAIIEE